MSWCNPDTIRRVKSHLGACMEIRVTATLSLPESHRDAQGQLTGNPTFNAFNKEDIEAGIKSSVKVVRGN